MTDKFSAKELEQFREIFKIFAKQGADKFGPKQLQEVMTSYGMSSTVQEAKELINEMDSTGTESLDFEGFVEAFMKKTKDSEAEEELREALKVFDKDNNGFLSVDELRIALTEWGDGLTSEEVDEMLHELDINDREIDFEELITIWMSAHKSK